MTAKPWWLGCLGGPSRRTVASGSRVGVSGLERQAQKLGCDMASYYLVE